MTYASNILSHSATQPLTNVQIAVDAAAHDGGDDAFWCLYGAMGKGKPAAKASLRRYGDLTYLFLALTLLGTRPG